MEDDRVGRPRGLEEWAGPLWELAERASRAGYLW